ncbi:hypothetical protein RhiJN_09907 [Ceratobasidium sp. AG-Ba]|nr:hypothetical protein RhiJN_09907 [Ceratobasidium sp. AG-Ba]QRW10667.1 hypothetical protein RhiLY_09666 [Ceratobasidium sp. AG-Ba]
MLLSHSFAAVSLATSFVAARPLPHYRRQNAITDFGTCKATPDIIFALGLDGRKDPAFQAKNNDVYNHGSALGIGVITSFICQQLNDKCKAPAPTLAACAEGQKAAAKVQGGGAADAFNRAFGISTNFASSGAGSGSGDATKTTLAISSSVETSAPVSSPTDSASTCAVASTVTVTLQPTAEATPCPTDPVTVTVTGTAPTATPTEIVAIASDTSSIGAETSTSSATPPATTGGAVSSLDFGSCTNPAIEFGPAFEGRKASEFSNKPENKDEFPQASALNINIITKAICNFLKDKCGAPTSTLDACQRGITAAASAPPKTGQGADLFNAALGIKTDFTNVPAAPGGGPGSVALATTPNFGSCTNPTIEFGVGFDGRTEASFRPANTQSFNHGSALNPGIIATAICDTLVNSCNANQPAIDVCNKAKAAITGLSGQAVADAFNAEVTKSSSV